MLARMQSIKHSYGELMVPEDVLALQNLVRKLGAPRIIEVGSWLGASAVAMRAAGGAEVHCIDTWMGTDDPTDATYRVSTEFGLGKILTHFCENVGEDLGVGIFMHIGCSAYWASRCRWKADMVFLDADHRYRATLADIKRWTPHLRRGGILAGHDYLTAFNDHHPGVNRAVNETGPFHTAGASIWWREIA